MIDKRLSIVEGPIRLDRLAFLSTIQLFVTETEEADSIRGFGSGFFLIHEGNTYFITADHLIHLDDHDISNETGQRIGKDLIAHIITNIDVKNEIATVTLPTSGYYFLTGFRLDRNDYKSNEDFFSAFLKIINNEVKIDDESLPIETRIADFPDVAITEISKPFHYLPYSNQVIDANKEIIVKDKESKIFLYSSSISEIDEYSTYIVAGTVKNDIKNSCVINRENVCHGDLKFLSIEKDGNILLKSSEEPQIENWAGLSGAPVFNDKGILVGMLLRGPVTEPIITVMPIKKILHFITQIKLQKEVGK